MAAGIGMAGGAGDPQPDRVAALLVDAQRVLAEVERLLLGAQKAGVEISARHLAAQQASIVAAAHDEAAAVLAAAQADAERIRDHAATSAVDSNPLRAGSAPALTSVIDLRDEARHAGTTPTSVGSVAQPASGAAVASTPPAAAGGLASADVRATLSAAADMARRVSSRIERLSRDLHESPAP